MDPASRRPNSLRWIAGGLVLGVAAGWFVGGNTWRLHAGPEWYETELFSGKGQLDGRSALSLFTGGRGMVFHFVKRTFYDSNYHLVFDHDAADGFSAGIQENHDGRVVDLGPAADVASRAGGSPFARLRWTDDSLCLDGSRLEPEDPPNGNSVVREPRSAPVHVGHLYLVAVRRSEHRHGEPMTWTPALVEVLEHEPRSSVKIRWNNVR